jgi:hypothetical protein
MAEIGETSGVPIDDLVLRVHTQPHYTILTERKHPKLKDVIYVSDEDWITLQEAL